MKLFRLSILLGSMALIASSAQANQIKFTFDFSRLQPGTFSLNRGGGLWMTETVYAGKGTATVLDAGLSPYLALGQSFDTYCVDLLRIIYSGSTPQVQLASMQDWKQQNIGVANPALFPLANNPKAGDMAAYLYNTYRNDGLNASDKAKREAGLQLSIWEVLYEGSPESSGPLAFDLGNGNIRFSNFDPQVLNYASGYLNSLPVYGSKAGSDALWLQTENQGIGLNTPTQDFIGPETTPEPGSLLLVGSGVVLFGGVALRKQKQGRKSFG
jgi:hypothetical protein